MLSLPSILKHKATFAFRPGFKCECASSRGREGDCFDFFSAEGLDTGSALTFPFSEHSTLLPVRLQILKDGNFLLQES